MRPQLDEDTMASPAECSRAPMPIEWRLTLRRWADMFRAMGCELRAAEIEEMLK